MQICILLIRYLGIKSWNEATNVQGGSFQIISLIQKLSDSHVQRLSPRWSPIFSPLQKFNQHSVKTILITPNLSKPQ